MLDLARAMQSRYTVFYNGPRCGASAPDTHFQAGDTGFMTIESEYDRSRRADRDDAQRCSLRVRSIRRSVDRIGGPRRGRRRVPRSCIATKQHRAVRRGADMKSSPTSTPAMARDRPAAHQASAEFFLADASKKSCSARDGGPGRVCILPVEQDFSGLGSITRAIAGEVMRRPNPSPTRRCVRRSSAKILAMTRVPSSASRPTRAIRGSYLSTITYAAAVEKAGACRCSFRSPSITR